MINENTKKDDVGFFNRLYNQYYQKIYKYILFITGVRFSEDIVQETFCTAWEKKHTHHLKIGFIKPQGIK